MNIIEYSNAITKIFTYYGEDTQKKKLQEECAELIRAIARNDYNNMLEEMADVQILLDQFRQYNRNIGKIEGIKFAKIGRTLKRIEKAEQMEVEND